MGGGGCAGWEAHSGCAHGAHGKWLWSWLWAQLSGGPSVCAWLGILGYCVEGLAALSLGLAPGLWQPCVEGGRPHAVPYALGRVSRSNLPAQEHAGLGLGTAQ